MGYITQRKGISKIEIKLLLILSLIITILGLFAVVGCGVDKELSGDTTERTYKNDTLGIKFATPIENSWHFLSEDSIEYWVDKGLDETEDDQASKDIAKTLTKIEFIAKDDRTGESVIFGYQKLVGKDKNITVEEYRAELQKELAKNEERKYSFGGTTNSALCGETYLRFTCKTKVEVLGGYITVEQYCYLRKVDDCIAVIVATSSDTSVEDFEKMFSLEMEFKFLGGRYALSSIGGCRDENIIIPSLHNGFPVTEIGADAFKDARFLETVVIPEGIVSIRDSAFENCSSLTEVAIPNSVEDIGDNAFAGNASLNSITIGDGVLEIGERAFSGCAFKSIDIPEGVRSIGTNAFGGCTALESITIGNGLQKLGNDVFNNCNNLKYNKYGNICYLGNESNPYLILKRIEDKEITSIEIAQGTKFIYHGYYEDSGFEGLNNLNAINVDENNEIFASQDGILYNKEKTELLHIPRNIAGQITIPNTLIELKTYAFSGLSKVTEIVFEDNSTFVELGESTFYKCPILEKVVLPNGLEKIGQYSFKDCKKLKSVNIPNGVTKVGTGIFKNCVELESIEIPNTLSIIGGEMFMDCSKLTYVVFKEGSQIRYIEQRMFYGCTALTSINLPDKVESIWEDSFWGCTALTDINVSENNEKFSSVDGILYSKDKTELVFCPESKQGEFIIPNYVVNIQNKAFSHCEKLTSVKVEENSLLESIGGYAFQDCKNLIKVEIPDTVVTMGVCVFAGCSLLKDIYYDGTKEQWETIPDKSSWDDYLENYTLHCSDGDILK